MSLSPQPLQPSWGEKLRHWAIFKIYLVSPTPAAWTMLNCWFEEVYEIFPPTTERTSRISVLFDASCFAAVLPNKPTNKETNTRAALLLQRQTLQLGRNLNNKLRSQSFTHSLKSSMVLVLVVVSVILRQLRHCGSCFCYFLYLCRCRLTTFEIWKFAPTSALTENGGFRLR